MTTVKTETKFSVVNRIKSLGHAIRGLGVFFRSTHAAWIHIATAIVVVCLGFALKISSTEWMFIVFSCGLVLITESINTAIEIDIDLTSPEYHPFARDTKDVAAGAVLLAAITAVIMGLIIFLPKIFLLIQ
ncbi:MAG: diacylglycerol kinase family protein [Patescibacteria group bacterium]